ncbi:complement factor H-related protein 3-like [Alligator sinensis]|uniref:Complement factor H-related protein 3-like n=1 Tax=Alligator sinensis TaxID=38654 RepID=A0A3Q0GCW5_ALLSI|nr:complement factor H-related protein 3-like [Alligator sinensis]
MSAVAGARFPFWILRMTLLRYMFLQILWAYFSQAEEPCTVDVTEMQSRGIELSEKSKGKQYIPHGDFVEFKCKVGYAHPAVWSASDFTVQCYSSNVSYPQCYKEICPVLDLENGRIYYSYWRKFREGATTSYSCKRDYSPENEQDRITCTKNGWSPTPRCIPESKKYLCFID